MLLLRLILIHKQQQKQHEIGGDQHLLMTLIGVEHGVGSSRQVSSWMDGQRRIGINKSTVDHRDEWSASVDFPYLLILLVACHAD